MLSFPYIIVPSFWLLLLFHYDSSIWWMFTANDDYWCWLPMLSTIEEYQCRLPMLTTCQLMPAGKMPAKKVQKSVKDKGPSWIKKTNPKNVCIHTYYINQTKSNKKGSKSGHNAAVDASWQNDGIFAFSQALLTSFPGLMLTTNVNYQCWVPLLTKKVVNAIWYNTTSSL